MRENQALFATIDWSATPLGPIDGWPGEMRAVIDTALASGFPVSTVWGEEGIQIYNDAYNHIYGDKHPAAFGRPVRESWPEIRDFLEPALRQVRMTREPLNFHDTLLPLARQGTPEECWFDFSYSAVPGADGQTLGLISIAVEKTRDVVLARRHATCDIPLDAMTGGNLDDLAAVLLERLRGNPMDAAAAVLIAFDPRYGAASTTLWQIGDWTGLAEWATARYPLPGQLVQLEADAPGRPDQASTLVTLVTLLDDRRQPIALLALAAHVLVPAASHLGFATSLCSRLQSVLTHADTLVAYRRRIAEQDTLYRFLFDNIVDAVVYARTDGGADSSATVVAANPSACHMFGYTLDELCGMPREQLMFPGLATLRDALVIREREKTFLGELTFQHKDGSPVQAEVSSRLVVSRDGSMHSVSILRDVSRRAIQAAEQARHARFEAIAQLTAGMAHDFNNLLTVVQGSLELVMDDLPEAARAREYAANALLCAERGAALTGQLMAYSRRQLLSLETEDLNARVLELLPLIQATVGERIDVVLALDPNLPPCRTDLAQLTTAVLNLAANARDAMPTGGAIRISTERDPLDGDLVVLRVCDEGTGVPDYVLDRIFEPYYSTKALGAGLGLAMVQGFVHQSGGRVRVTNPESGGACFELFLPVATSDQPTLHDEARPPLSIVPGTHVLLVDDHPLIRGQTREILSRAGFRVSVAADAQGALAQLSDGLPDLLLTDVDMPGELDGLALAREARSRFPDLPVLVMTGHNPQALTDADVGESVATLAKPFDRGALLHAIAVQLPAPA